MGKYNETVAISWGSVLRSLDYVADLRIRHFKRHFDDVNYFSEHNYPERSKRSMGYALEEAPMVFRQISLSNSIRELLGYKQKDYKVGYIYEFFSQYNKNSLSAGTDKATFANSLTFQNNSDMGKLAHFSTSINDE